MKKYRAHPWHGISYNTDFPNKIIVFIEIVPSDTIKYEIHKSSGYLMVDRPQKFSNVVPALYGFLPKTYCGEKTAKLAQFINNNYIGFSGDNDPLDVLVLTSHHFFHGDILLNAIPIGGFCMIDKNEIDDKIIAVLFNDHVYGKIKDISELPNDIILRLKHYFLTYKYHPEQKTNFISIEKIYGFNHAKKVIMESTKDYDNYITMKD